MKRFTVIFLALAMIFTSFSYSFADTSADVPELTGISPGYYKTVPGDITFDCSGLSYDIDSAVYVITKDGEQDEPSPIDANGRIPENLFSEDGKYNVAVYYTYTDDGVPAKRVTSVDFTVDSVPPEISISGVPEITKGSVTPEIGISDPNMKDSDITVTLNGDEIDFQETFSAEGKYAITVFAEDLAGNSSQEDIAFEIDKTAPSVEITGGESGYVTSLRDLSFSAPDEDTETLEVKAVRRSDDLIVAGEGQHTASLEDPEPSQKDGDAWDIEVKATDKAGNVTSKQLSVIRDEMAPVIVISGPEDGKIYKTDVNYSVSVTDRNLDTKGVVVTFDGEENAVPQQGSFSEEGDYELTVTAKDKVGNESEKSVSFTIDKTAPLVTFTGVENDAHYSMDKTVTVKSNEPGTVKYTVYLDGELISSEEAQNEAVTDVLSDEGKYLIKAFSTDEAGNIGPENSISFVIDKTLPSVSVEGVESGMRYNRDVTLSCAIEELYQDTAELIITKDGEQAVSETLNPTLTEEGEYTATLTVTDKAGNTSSATVSFVIDKTAPVTEVIGAEDGQYYASDIKITLKANEASNVFWTLARANHTGDPIEGSGESPAALESITEDGTYILTYHSVDTAGNIEEDRSISFTLDKTAPRVHINGAEDGKFYNSNLLVSGSVRDDNPDIAELRITKNGKPFGGTDLSRHITDEGEYTVTIYAKDKAGNEAERTITFTVDKTAPVVTLSGPAKGAHYISPAETNISANEPATIYVSVKRDGSQVYSGTLTDEGIFGTYASDGDYTVSAYAVDRAGNRGAIASLSFVKDSTAPVISITGADEGGWHNTTRNIAIQVNERYFATDKVNVSIERTLNGQTSSIPFSYKSDKEVSVNTATLSETGEYLITVNAVDEAGNKAVQKTLSFKLDTVDPVIKITIPKTESGYDDQVTPKVEISDDYFDTKDIVIRKTYGEGSGQTVTVPYSENFTDKGGSRQYSDMEKTERNDGIYTINVSAKDKAGNVATGSMTYVVDRYGSKFIVRVAPEEKYVRDVTDDIEIEEINVASIAGYKAVVQRDGETFEADGVTYDRNGMSTLYTIPKDNFEKEGVYRVNLITSDNAGNVSESEKDAEIWFAVDRTAPQLDITGAEDSDVIKEDTLTLRISSMDTISDEVILSAKVNGEDVEILKDDDGYYIVLEKGRKQTVKVTAEDMAGNVTEKEIKNITVGTLPVSPAVPAGISAGVLAGAGAIFAVLKKKKKKDDGSSSDGDDLVI